MKSWQRISNLELLRILSMFMIVISHYFVHNSISNNSLPLGANRLLAEIMSFGTVGVVLFMLISGYCLGSSNKPLRFSKLLRVVFQVFTYSSTIFVIAVLFLGEKITLGNLTKSFLPVSFGTYWFVTAYIGIYVFHPFINRLLNGLSRREYIGFLVALFVLYSAIRTITGKDFYAGQAGLFLLYYATGNYLRIYDNNFFSIRRNRIFILLLSLMIVISTIIVFDLIGGSLGAHSNYLITSRGSVFSIIIAVCIFCSIVYSRKIQSRAINTIASSTFGIYLIHDNPFVRKIIWTDVFHNPDFISSNYLVLHMLGVVIVIFSVCGIIELIRKNTLEKLYVVILSPCIDKAQEKIEKRSQKA